jgi:hypothetical protein
LFNLKKPCDQCPFVKNSMMNKTLSEGRVTDIVEDLLSDDKKTFTCHKTIDYNEMDENNELVRNPQKEEMCFGSMIFLQKIRRPHVSQRLAYALGILDHNNLVKNGDLVIDPVQAS